MADKKDAAETAASKAKATITDKIIEPAKAADAAMRASGSKIAEGSATMSMKIIDQAEENAREAFAAMREAAKANDIAGVMKVQGDYLRAQGSRSMGQAREIGEMIAQFGKDALAPLRGSKD